MRRNAAAAQRDRGRQAAPAPRTGDRAAEPNRRAGEPTRFAADDVRAARYLAHPVSAIAARARVDDNSVSNCAYRSPPLPRCRARARRLRDTGAGPAPRARAAATSGRRRRRRRRSRPRRSPAIPEPFPPEISARARGAAAARRGPVGSHPQRLRDARARDPYVTKWEEWYSSRPDYVARMVDRSRRYLYYIVVEVEQRGMPLEIALLPMVESAFNPVALSSSRASGIWQFMPSTGTHYGLKQNFWFDSRRDVIAATDGALNYLQKLYAQFNDWQLALAAYNWGEGNVARAIERNQKAGKPTDYASLAMPDETRNYLPKLQAVKNIVRDPGQLQPRPRRHPRRAVLRRGQDVPPDGRQARGRAGGTVDRGIPVPQSASQPAGDRRRRRVRDPAADRQGRALRRQARADRPAAGLVAGVPAAHGRDAGAARGAARDVRGDAARGQRHRREGAGAGRATRCWCRRSGPRPSRRRR